MYYVASGVYSSSIYLLEGYVVNAPLQSTQKYDTQADTWTSTRRVPTSRITEMGAAVAASFKQCAVLAIDAATTLATCAGAVEGLG